MTPAEFPVLLGYGSERREAEALDAPLSVPWALVEPHERQAQQNHSQTLKRLAERGGLCPSELAAVLEDRRWRSMPLPEALAVVREHLDRFNGPATVVPVWSAEGAPMCTDTCPSHDGKRCAALGLRAHEGQPCEPMVVEMGRALRARGLDPRSLRP